MAHIKLKQQDAKALAEGYSRAFRRVEIGSILSFAVLMVLLGVKVAPHGGESPWLLLAAMLCGYLAADFVSGFVHWLADTWGSLSTPLVGKTLIRPFREHHVDEKAMTRHDFVETNGANCLISLPAALVALAIPLGPGHWHWLRLFGATFLGAMIFWVMATNQFHKWSHMDEPPTLVAWLQRLHLILPPAHHAIHHTAPFAKYYCITVGWLNWPLTKLHFFPTLERMMTATLGWLPRQDDIGTEAALAIAPGIENEQKHSTLVAAPPQH
ncbi:MAG: fatty acid desaturase family protein [Myxococcota bacterium]